MEKKLWKKVRGLKVMEKSPNGAPIKAQGKNVSGKKVIGFEVRGKKSQYVHCTHRGLSWLKNNKII